MASALEQFVNTVRNLSSQGKNDRKFSRRSRFEVISPVRLLQEIIENCAII